jgi:putative ABC transport system permease protein
MILARHAVQLVVRDLRRSIATLVGTAIAAALVASVLMFGTASGATMTRRALSDVPVDAQVVVAPKADPNAAAAIAAADPAVRSTARFDVVHFDTARTTKAGAATETSSGVLLGLSPDYSQTTALFKVSAGRQDAHAVTVSRDLASNLGVVPGDEITFTLPGGGSAVLKVSGVVDITGADLILGPIDAAHRAAGANPPTNVAAMPIADLETLVLPKVSPGTTAADPSASTGGAQPVFAPEPAVRREVQLQLRHELLPGDPVAARQWLDAVRRRLDRQGNGSFQTIDDASASLEPLATDLAWGQILYIFLALPGIALALALSRLAADATADSTRRHAALLRARGASPRTIAGIFVGSIALTSLIGSLLGGIAGVALGIAMFGGDIATIDPAGTIVRVLVISVVLTTALATLAAALPLRAQLRSDVAAGRQELQRTSAPLWQRLYLDVLAIVAAVIVWFATGGTGVHPVLNAEGNPTVTLALTSFVAPFLLWTGGTLLLLRIVGWLMQRGAPLRRALGRALGPSGALAAASLRARAAGASRAMVVLAMAVGFATSVLLFDATYRQQQLVDARLTLGADLRAAPSSPTPASMTSHAQGPGVAAVTPFVDRVVYVGPEAQDLLAIDPARLPAVAPLADSFFSGLTASGAMDALRSRPDAILVSAETAKDYSIVPGDLIRIRVPDASGTLRTVEFHMAGIALEFPTAPKDAFLVGNLDYVASQTANDRISFVLARADGDVADAGRRLATRLGTGWSVSDLSTTSARLANSITSVDLAGLVAIDVAFALVIATVGLALFLLAGLAERRRELATLVAIGAEPGQMRRSIAGEAITIALMGAIAGLVVGTIVGLALLQILAGVFDPPPDVPALPATSVFALVVAVCLAVAGAIVIADRGVTRLNVVGALRER